MQRIHVEIHGQVKGVGFRVFVQKLAREKNLKGFVTNTPKGSVEILAEGKPVSIKEFIRECEKGPRFAGVKKIDVNYHEATGSFDNFAIRQA